MSDYKFKVDEKLMDVDFEHNKISQRSFDVAQATKVKLTETGMARLAYDAAFKFPDNSNDLNNYLIAHYYECSEEFNVEIQIDLLKKERYFDIDLSQFDLGDEIHFWIFVKSASENLVSEPSYAGSVFIEGEAAQEKQPIRQYRKEDIIPIVMSVLNIMHTMLMIDLFNVALQTTHKDLLGLVPDDEMTEDIAKMISYMKDPFTVMIAPSLNIYIETIEKLEQINGLNMNDIVANESIAKQAEDFYFDLAWEWEAPKNHVDSLHWIAGTVWSHFNIIYCLILLIERREVDFEEAQKNWYTLGSEAFCTGKERYDSNLNSSLLHHLWKDLQEYPQKIWQYILGVEGKNRAISYN